MKIVGIIGGLGPETTSKFYLELNRQCFEVNKDTHPPILIWNIPLPCVVEKEAITEAKGEERCLPYLISAAQRLEKAGADFLVMPCNSLHIFIDEIRQSVKVPVLSITEETTKFLKDHNIDKVGILATSITVNRSLYNKGFKDSGISQILPEDGEQVILNHIVHRLVLGKYLDGDKVEIDNMINHFKRKGIKTVLLACTDLQLLIPHHSHVKIYDTMEVLLQATLREILK